MIGALCSLLQTMKSSWMATTASPSIVSEGSCRSGVCEMLRQSREERSIDRSCCSSSGQVRPVDARQGCAFSLNENETTITIFAVPRMQFLCHCRTSHGVYNGHSAIWRWEFDTVPLLYPSAVTDLTRIDVNSCRQITRTDSSAGRAKD